MNRLLGAVLAVVVAAMLSGCSKNNEPDVGFPNTVVTTALVTTTATSAPATTTPATAVVRTAVPGFGEVAIRVSSGPELCALLARTAAQRGRGLMGRTDLAGHVGMLFAFQADSAVPFHMKDTPMPLSIAWFDAAGRFVSAKDMTPCLDKPTCPGYAAAGPYRYALEVPQGGLSALGIGPGAVLTGGGHC